MTIEVSNLTAFAGGDDETTGDLDVDDDSPPQRSWIERWSPLVAVLSGVGSEIDDVMDDLDPDLLKEPERDLPPEELTLLKESLETLDANLRQQIVEALEDGITPEDALKIGAQLEETECVGDGERIAGWLQRVAALG
jgi:hypothetical protein